MSKNLKATLRYAATAPSPEQVEKIKSVLSGKFDVDSSDIELEFQEDSSIGGGFIVSCGNYEYDWSDAGRAKQLRSELINVRRSSGDSDPARIMSLFRSKVDDFDLSVGDREVGFVEWVGDGIANITGIEHAFYGEIIEFEDGTRGMAQDIREDHIGCILFGNDTGIRQGTRAVRTYKEAGIPVGEAFIGRVVDALGTPLDGLGDIKESGYSAVEKKAPGIIERQSVNEPLQTGILSIDTMFPIGRGQRELIIGDRQTGKTSIALDTIINQKGKEVICIYVAIGQKASTVAKIIQTLKKTGAMDYTIIVSSTAADTAPLQYIAPYSGTAMAEYFMSQGKAVLIVYDDLSKHAVAYRAISLLLERPPGREAYPGDVFYLHSRLLERSSKLSSELGGGSITALPIIETQAGDVSSYIPTNVISITDGQIFLESDLFFEGMRPAVNVGLSVSRVGSAAQTKAMKKAAGSIRVDLAQYREMAVFTQFSSDLDETTKNQLRHGNVLMELLKQPLEHPLAMHEQVIILVAVGSGRLDSVPVPKVRDLKDRLLNFFNTEHGDICSELEKSGQMSDQLKRRILEAVDMFMEDETE
ncbi:F0F1 ATP synthase subunit alpha [Butyrivibrio sp. DSM 10294]|uniref:F0F1 ATP synthase subunit alpha n=1 Tax=Butyrivibrio sp. DSM 10294 TaxID=2972457 RepID=UPI00234FB3D4|nr:F0F1 ATP synthase subunit alpha [Butyrivibrio sp. DSM 10294]MDC7293939.1 F0F1 ATP synthase subunit alpha [Butyrivibrio sp. DSM 10294]